ncbi:MAG: phenylalanine--tRNA ligase subunit alpha [Bacilli bacterium]|nr:phenylalanine--tRNA ligase subunit alpha [Bacilli bacterium]MBN2696106.1 phenylalanine--tRNA ligase subunit alpha [Bacilli bacterium]
MNNLQQLKTIIEEATTKIKSCLTFNELADVKAAYLGKKSVFAEMMQQMKDLQPEDRPAFGQKINEAKTEISDFIDSRRKEIESEMIRIKLEKESVDVSLPGKDIRQGAKHLISQVIEEVEDLFIGMGYSIEEGPEIESDLYNFEMLNLPKTHPARDMQDSLYITEDTLLRTHTSPVQVRTMLRHSAANEPIKIICPGKVYRKDDDDQTHSHQFTQIEALVVDESSSISDLKGTLLVLAKKLFGEERQIRLRPSYFPFTEPSVEVDVSCHKCNGAGCSMCKGSGWIEILGAGMVNNAVLEAAGYDTSRFQGFALGMGIERIAILKYGIDDIRAFYTNDMRFNRQFL